MSIKPGFNRRDFLNLSVAAGTTAVLTACGINNQVQQAVNNLCRRDIDNFESPLGCDNPIPNPQGAVDQTMRGLRYNIDWSYIAAYQQTQDVLRQHEAELRVLTTLIGNVSQETRYLEYTGADPVGFANELAEKTLADGRPLLVEVGPSGMESPPMVAASGLFPDATILAFDKEITPPTEFPRPIPLPSDSSLAVFFNTDVVLLDSDKVKADRVYGLALNTRDVPGVLAKACLLVKSTGDIIIVPDPILVQHEVPADLMKQVPSRLCIFEPTQFLTLDEIEILLGTRASFFIQRELPAGKTTPVIIARPAP